MNIDRLLDKKNFEKIDEFFSINKNDTYFFSVEDLDAIDSPDVEHLFFQNVLNRYTVSYTHLTLPTILRV